MNQPMGYVNAADFKVDGKTVKSATISSSDNRVVVLTLNAGDALDADATAAGASSTPVNVTISNPVSSNPSVGLTNAPVLAADSVVVEDGIAAQVLFNATTDKITVDLNASSASTTEGLEVTSDPTDFSAGKNRITVNFNEAVYAVNNAKLGDNFKLYREDGTQLVHGLDYTVVISSGAVQIDLLRTGSKLVGYDGNLQVVFDNANGNIIDAAGNLADGFDTASDVADATKDLIVFTASPIITAASLADAGVDNDEFGDVGDKLKITFSENVQLTTATAGEITAAELAKIDSALAVTGGTYAYTVSGNVLTITVVTAATANLDNSGTIDIDGTSASQIVSDYAGNDLIVVSPKVEVKN